MITQHKKIVRAFGVMISFAPLVAFAQTPPTNGGSGTAVTNGGTGTTVTNGGSGLTNPLQATDLNSLIAEILKYAVQIGTIFLTLMLIYVGFQFVAARGNEEKLQNAKSALLWTVIGGLLLLGASAIASAIAATATSL